MREALHLIGSVKRDRWDSFARQLGLTGGQTEDRIRDHLGNEMKSYRYREPSQTGSRPGIYAAHYPGCVYVYTDGKRNRGALKAQIRAANDDMPAEGSIKRGTSLLIPFNKESIGYMLGLARPGETLDLNSAFASIGRWNTFSNGDLKIERIGSDTVSVEFNGDGNVGAQMTAYAGMMNTIQDHAYVMQQLQRRMQASAR